jgi:hypothetical protein
VARRKTTIRAGTLTNVALFAFLSAAFLTGWLAFAFATAAPSRWSLVAHAISGFAILVLMPWKSMIVGRGLQRGQPGRWASIVFGVSVFVSLAAGLAHSTGLVLSLGPFTPMEVHVGAALIAVPLAIWHIAARRSRPRLADFSRRNFLRGGMVAAGAAAMYAASEGAVRAAALPGASRRFTGSYETGSYQPDLMPVSSWMFDAIPHIDTATWRLLAGDRAWTYEHLLSYGDHVAATLDCTGGFYSTQLWDGVRVDRLVGTARGSSIRVVSSTGYDRRFPFDEAGSLLVATHFGGIPLDAGHGFPARLVAPNRRGFWWVKWIVAIEVDDLPHWWQSPFPLQ